jgi:predicted ABC-type transport system involved in lysophospholipase L1 biosynthesis ATPase subunit
VIVTHDPAIVRRCSRVVRMHSGVLEEEPVREGVRAAEA